MQSTKSLGALYSELGSGLLQAGRYEEAVEALRKALSPLLGKIDIATMREANLRAAGNDATSSPDAVAQWLWEKVGKK